MISIRWRLTILLGLAVGTLFVATGAGVYLAMGEMLRAQFDETLTAKARALITASEIDGGEFEIDLTVKDFAGFGKGGSDYFEIRRGDGTVFLQSPSMASGEGIGGLTGWETVPADEAPRIHAVSLSDGRAARMYVQRLSPKGDKKRRFQDLHLAVASPTRGMQAQRVMLATVLAIAGAVALLLMIPVIRLGLGRGLRPLDQLSQDLARVGPENLNERVSTARLPSELVPVATRLNEWLERLQASFERERRFSSHAAHELRTPLAEIKSLAELGALWPEKADRAQWTDLVAAATEMETLLDRLTWLSRADSGRHPVARQPVDLEASVATAVARWEARAAERRIRVRVWAETGEFRTDPVLWGTVLQNLVGNAVFHAPEGSEVTVTVSPRTLVVANPAPDLKPEDLERMFERFWRKDTARTGYGHSGLGLSVVNACVTLLGGICSARLKEDGRLEMEVTWAPE